MSYVVGVNNDSRGCINNSFRWACLCNTISQYRKKKKHKRKTTQPRCVCETLTTPYDQLQGQGREVNILVPKKGLVARNIHVKYECPITIHLNDMDNV